MPVVLFDLMDTLVEDPYHRMFSTGFPLKQFLRWKDRESFVEFERGEISEAEFFRRYYRAETPDDLLAILPNPRKIKKEMFRFIRPIDGVFELARDLCLRPGVAVGIASNYSEWYGHILKLQGGLLDFSSYLFFSCELGARKPDREYYTRIEHALRTRRVISSSHEILFIDDRVANVEGAAAAGWRSFPFTTAPLAREELNAALAEPLFQ